MENDQLDAETRGALLREAIRKAGNRKRRTDAAAKRADETLSEAMKRGRAEGIPIREMQRIAGIEHYNTAAGLAGGVTGYVPKAQREAKE